MHSRGTPRQAVPCQGVPSRAGGARRRPEQAAPGAMRYVLRGAGAHGDRGRGWGRPGEAVAGGWGEHRSCPPPVKPGPMLDVRWRRETETRGSGRGVRGGAGQWGRGGLGPPRIIHPRAPCCCPGGPSPGWGGGVVSHLLLKTSCDGSVLPRVGGQRVGQRAGRAACAGGHGIAVLRHQQCSSVHGHRTGTAGPLCRCGAATAMVLHGHYTRMAWPLHHHCSSMHGHCDGAAQLLHSHCSRVGRPLHHHCSSMHGHCTAQLSHCTSTARHSAATTRALPSMHGAAPASDGTGTPGGLWPLPPARRHVFGQCWMAHAAQACVTMGGGGVSPSPCAPPHGFLLHNLQPCLLGGHIGTPPRPAPGTWGESFKTFCTTCKVALLRGAGGTVTPPRLPGHPCCHSPAMPQPHCTP
ncbi:uncharacterized protein LOC119158904 [Falco rusticolus]|uniref:uncharacterized protein LOC119158904 n=1 Tax=Falco rusticolus TaxID=120794 RepID=UPI0018865F21|nr:uncharacterized protein LOC119158904 [Falco rusticolus]